MDPVAASTRSCIGDNVPGCRIVVSATSMDNDCLNVGANTQRLRIITRITNNGTGTFNLTDERTFTIEAKDDDPPSRIFDGKTINWKPYC